MSSRTALPRYSLNLKFQILQFFNRVASRYTFIKRSKIIKIRFRLNNKRFYRLDFFRWICIFYQRLKFVPLIRLHCSTNNVHASLFINCNSAAIIKQRIRTVMFAIIMRLLFQTARVLFVRERVGGVIGSRRTIIL